MYNHYYGIQNRQGYLIQNTKYLKECPSGKMEDNIHGQATTEHLAVVTESSRLSLVVPDPVVTDSGHLSPIVSDPSRLSLIVTEPGRLSPSVGSDPDRLSPIQVVDPPRHLFKKTSPSNLLTLYLPRWDPILVQGRQASMWSSKNKKQLHKKILSDPKTKNSHTFSRNGIWSHQKVRFLKLDCLIKSGDCKR